MTAKSLRVVVERPLVSLHEQVTVVELTTGAPTHAAIAALGISIVLAKIAPESAELASNARRIDDRARDLVGVSSTLRLTPPHANSEVEESDMLSPCSSFLDVGTALASQKILNNILEMRSFSQ